MYLIAAEAENEVNGPANAYQYVNKIRWRARVNKSSTTDVPDLKNPGKDQFPTQEITNNNIKQNPQYQ
jgi:hypothetical protein